MKGIREDFDYIRIDREIKNIIDRLDLNQGYKYYCMVFMNKVVYTFLEQGKQIQFDVFFVSKSIENVKNSIFGDKKIVYTCIRALEQAKLIERGTSYMIGEYSKGFKPLILPNNGMITVQASNYLSPKQLGRFKNRILKLCIKGVEWHFNNILKNIELDAEKVKKLILSQFGKNLKVKDQAKLIEKVCDIEIKQDLIKQCLKNQGIKRIDKKVLEHEYQSRIFLRLKILELLDIKNTTVVVGEKGGRHFHVLSNAPRLLRACVVSKDPKKPYLMQIDIKNSQPFFLLCLFEKNKLAIEKELKISTIKGKFYEDIGACWGYDRYDITNDHNTRQEIKRKVYSNLLFASDHIRKTSIYFKKVKARYPLFAKAIFDLTQDGATLASLLQHLEADEVLPVVKKFGAIGLHDAIIIPAANETDTVEKIKKELLSRFEKKYKLIPSVSVEKISEREK